MASNTKRKFSKLLGKKVEYVGVKTEPAEEHEGGRVLLTNVRHKGKLYADHAWIGNTDALDRFEFGEKIGFTGVAIMYTDSNGERKQGLYRCHNFHTIHDTYDKGTARRDLDQTFKRKKNRKYS